MLLKFFKEMLLFLLLDISVLVLKTIMSALRKNHTQLNFSSTLILVRQYFIINPGDQHKLPKGFKGEKKAGVYNLLFYRNPINS